jgi:hypothetical protein
MPLTLFNYSELDNKKWIELIEFISGREIKNGKFDKPIINYFVFSCIQLVFKNLLEIFIVGIFFYSGFFNIFLILFSISAIFNTSPRFYFVVLKSIFTNITNVSRNYAAPIENRFDTTYDI